MAAGAPLAAGDPFGYLHQGTDGPVQHVVYRGQDGHIHELYTLSNKWVFNTLTASGGAPLAGGDPFGYLHQAAAGPVQHVVYRSQNNDVVELCTFGNAWMFNIITVSAMT